MGTMFTHNDTQARRPEQQAQVMQQIWRTRASVGQKPDSQSTSARIIGTEVNMADKVETTQEPLSATGKRMPRIAVADWMSPNPITVEPGTPLSEAYSTMMRGGIRRLPVVEEGRLVGIVTLGDLREAKPSTANSLSIYELNYLLANLKVDQIMTQGPLTVEAEAPVQQAARIMLQNKISSLPVLDKNGELAGIITESDIFRMVVDRWKA